MGSRVILSLPTVVAAEPGQGPLECVLAACEDLLAAHSASARAEVEHVVLAGGAGAGLDIAALLPRRLGLAEHVTCTLAHGESGAAGLATLRIAEACCRGNGAARVLVACVGGARRAADALAPAVAALVSGSDHPRRGTGLRLERLATWSHRPESGELTLSECDDGFDLAASDYLGASQEMDLRGFLRDHLGLERKNVARAAWAVHSSAAGPGAGVPALSLDDVRRLLDLDDDRLASSRIALARHGALATSGVWQALQAAMSGDAADIIALGMGPGPTLEAAWLTRG